MEIHHICVKLNLANGGNKSPIFIRQIPNTWILFGQLFQNLLLKITIQIHTYTFII